MAWSHSGIICLKLLIFFLLPVINAAPLSELGADNLGYYPVSDKTGCYYNFQHYDEGDRIFTNEPCLNCTCHNKMLMCYLRVCPFIKAYGENCRVEKRADLCCPIITCPEVPVPLLSSNATQQGSSDTALGRPDTYGCSIDGLFYADGVRIPGDPSKPCELCYCIRNKTACVMQECTLKIQGCIPVYHKDICCPIKYNCDRPEQIEGSSDSEKGLIFTTTTTSTTTTTTARTSTEKTTSCIHNEEWYADGAQMPKEKPCESCYCMRSNMICAVQECAPTPLEKINCTPLPPPEGECCPKLYECDHNIDEGLLTTELFLEESTNRPGKVTSAVITMTATEVTDPPKIDQANNAESENSSEQSITEHTLNNEEKEKTTRQFVPTEHSTEIRGEESSTAKLSESSSSESTLDQSTIEITGVTEGDLNRPVISSESQVTTTESQDSEEIQKTTNRIPEGQKITQEVKESRSPETTEQYQTSTKQHEQFTSADSAASHEDDDSIEQTTKLQESFTGQSTEKSMKPEESSTGINDNEHPVMEISTVQFEEQSKGQSTSKTQGKNEGTTQLSSEQSSTEYEETQTTVNPPNIEEITSENTPKPEEVHAVEEEKTSDSEITKGTKKDDTTESELPSEYSTEKKDVMTTYPPTENDHPTQEYSPVEPEIPEQPQSITETITEKVADGNNNEKSTEIMQHEEDPSSLGNQGTTETEKQSEESTMKSVEKLPDVSATDISATESTVAKKDTNESTEPIISEKTPSEYTSQSSPLYESTEPVESSVQTTERNMYAEKEQSPDTESENTVTQGVIPDEEETAKGTTIQHSEEATEKSSNESSPEVSSTEVINPSNIQESTETADSGESTDSSKSQDHYPVSSSTQITDTSHESESVQPSNPGDVTQKHSEESTESAKVTDNSSELPPKQTTYGTEVEISTEFSKSDENLSASSSSEKIDESSSQEGVTDVLPTEMSGKPHQAPVEVDEHESQTTEEILDSSTEVEGSQETTKDYPVGETNISQKPTQLTEATELTPHEPHSESSTDKLEPFTSQEVHESEFTSLTQTTALPSESEHTTSTPKPFTSQEFDESSPPKIDTTSKQSDSTESTPFQELNPESPSSTKPYTSHEIGSPAIITTNNEIEKSTESGQSIEHSPGTVPLESQKSTDLSTESHLITEYTSKSDAQETTYFAQTTDEDKSSEEAQKTSRTPIEVSTEYSSHNSETTEERLVPGEGSCLVDGVTHENNAPIDPINQCHLSCKCVNSIVKCESVTCDPPKADLQNCMAVYQGPDTCCPIYNCETPGEQTMESDSQKKEKEKPQIPETTESSFGESTNATQYISESTTKLYEKVTPSNSEDHEVSTKESPLLGTEVSNGKPIVSETIEDTSSKEPTYQTTNKYSSSSTDSDGSGETKPSLTEEIENNEKQETTSQIYETVPTKSHKLEETTMLPGAAVTSSLRPGQQSTDSELSYTTLPILVDENEDVSTEQETDNELNISTVKTKPVSLTTVKNSLEESVTEEPIKPILIEDNGSQTEIPTIELTTKGKEAGITQSNNDEKLSTKNPIYENKEEEGTKSTSPLAEKEVTTEISKEINEADFESTESSAHVFDEHKPADSMTQKTSEAEETTVTEKQSSEHVFDEHKQAEYTTQKSSEAAETTVTEKQSSESATSSDGIPEKEDTQPVNPPDNAQVEPITTGESNPNVEQSTEQIVQSETSTAANESKPVSSTEYSTSEEVEKPENEKANTSSEETVTSEYVPEETGSPGNSVTNKPELDSQTEKQTPSAVEVSPETTEMVSSKDDQTISSTDNVNTIHGDVDAPTTTSYEETKTASISPSINEQTASSENKEPIVATTTTAAPLEESAASVELMTTKSPHDYDQESSTHIEEEKEHKTKPESSSLETESPPVSPDDINVPTELIIDQEHVTVPDSTKHGSSTIEITHPNVETEYSTDSVTITDASEQASSTSSEENEIEMTERISETTSTEKSEIIDNHLPEIITESSPPTDKPFIKPEDEKVVTVFNNEEKLSSTESTGSFEKQTQPDVGPTENVDVGFTTNAPEQEKTKPEESDTGEGSRTTVKVESMESTEKNMLESGAEQSASSTEVSEEKVDQTTSKLPDVVEAVEAATAISITKEDSTPYYESPVDEVTENKHTEKDIPTVATDSHQHITTEALEPLDKVTIKPNIQDTSIETTQFVKQESSTVSGENEADIKTEKVSGSESLPNFTEVEPEAVQTTEKRLEQEESTNNGPVDGLPTEKGTEEIQSTKKTPVDEQYTEQAPVEAQSTDKLHEVAQSTEKQPEEEHQTEKRPEDAQPTEKVEEQIVITERDPNEPLTSEKTIPTDFPPTYKPATDEAEPILVDDAEKVTSEVVTEPSVVAAEDISTEKEPLEHVTANASEIPPTKSVDVEPSTHQPEPLEEDRTTNGNVTPEEIEKGTEPGIISENEQTVKASDQTESSKSSTEIESTEIAIDKEPSTTATEVLEEHKISSPSYTTSKPLEVTDQTREPTIDENDVSEKATSEDDRYSVPTTQSSSESNLKDKDQEVATKIPSSEETSPSVPSEGHSIDTTGSQSTEEETATTKLPFTKYPDAEVDKKETVPYQDSEEPKQDFSKTPSTTEVITSSEGIHSSFGDEKVSTDVTTKVSDESEQEKVTESVTKYVHENEITTLKPESHKPASSEVVIPSATSAVIPQTTSQPEKLPSLPDYQEPDYEENGDEFGPGTCRYGGKVYVSAQQIPRDDPCDFCFCFRSDIICLQQSCPPPIRNCHQEPIRGFCCPRYECPVSMALSMNVTTTTTTTTTTLPPHFLSHAYKGKAVKAGCLIKGQAYQIGDPIPSASGPCLQCKCGGHGQMECNPVVCSPNPMLEQMLTVAAASKKRR